MVNTLLHILKRRWNTIALVCGSCAIFLILRIVPVYGILKTSYALPGLSFVRKIDIFLEYVIYSFTRISFHEQLLVIALSILTTLNIILFIVFTQRQQKLLSKRSFIASVSGMVLGLFGVGCVSCGVLVLAPLITALGLGAYLGTFTQYALLIAYIGLGFVIVSSLYLLRKISQPNICLS
ncbi:hypothetical protein KC866_00500 [Patescibacteria group bacterium]|nr:hypothetical protein [Patescibacteria group bacterium]